MRSKDHEHEAEKDGRMAECCGKMEECFSGMSKAAGGEDGKVYQKIADNWGAMKKAHADSKAHHMKASEAAKAYEDRLGKTIRPDGAWGIIPSDVPAEGFGHTAIPRRGQPPLEKAAIENVHPKFRHLLEIGEA